MEDDCYCAPRHSSGSRTLAQSSVLDNSKLIKHPDIDKLEETMEELTKLEFVERQNVEHDLREFQRNRRKLVFDVVSLQVSKNRRSLLDGGKKL
ncbi:hypothetical protein GWI33_016787 [Rhynchophorus ferrugineus]|uniref:Uncharacterized protein n=1 Tax=Rhynchophorus ferrugineus TaxID=354439 RepID=A0A834IAG9_RHYFE|nr:hypothetical protein GWI33_016787 [Rhynchophorus ferrugineus]